MIQEKAVEYVRALNAAPLEVVFAGPFDIGVDKVSSAINDVFDIGEARGVDKDELNTVIWVLKDGGGEFNDCLDEINLDLSQEFVIRVLESTNDGGCNSKKIMGFRNQDNFLNITLKTKWFLKVWRVLRRCFRRKDGPN
ncbi:hypothetical protein Tco_0036824, partial [Tanacetum coccineum]